MIQNVQTHRSIHGRRRRTQSLGPHARQAPQVSDLSCRSLVTQDFLDYVRADGSDVGLGGDSLTGDLDGNLA